jgi:ribonuclease HII
VNVADVPLSELRRRLEARRTPPSRALLDALAADPRAGVRALGRALARSRARASADARRVGVLFRRQRALAESEAIVAGVDEAGVGPLAGPVVAAAVVLPYGVRLAGLDDSKRVAPPDRERLDAEIRACALGVALGWASAAEIDQWNIYQASLLAMRRAVERLAPRPGLLLVDARRVPGVHVPQRSVIGGDGRVGAIAAASIVAKVYRDAWLRDLDRRHPGYGFDRNAGYATPEHLEALARLGPSPEHRFSFAPVREASKRRAERGARSEA